MASWDALDRFITDPNSPRVVGQSNQDLISQPLSNIKISSGGGPSGRDLTVIASPASDCQSTNPSTSPTRSLLSREESRSSHTSTAPSDSMGSVDGNLDTMSIRVLPCLLRDITLCDVTYDHSERFDWYRHSISHYLEEKPPTHAMCIFCDRIFENQSPTTCWKSRMYHIADHFENGLTLDYSKPDFYVIRDMWKKGCLQDEDYKHCVEYTERPSCKGLRDHDYIPDEIKRKQKAAYEQENRVAIPESKEERRDRLRGKRPTVVGSKKTSKSTTIVKKKGAANQLNS